MTTFHPWQASRLEEFNDYITEMWVDDDAKFQLVLWNQWANVEPRTNNNIEGFHNMLKNQIQKVHHNRYEFVTQVKKVGTRDRAEIAQVITEENHERENRSIGNWLSVLSVSKSPNNRQENPNAVLGCC